MNSLRIIKGPEGGIINPIPSKSTIHRSLICALLAQGKSEISNIIMSEDVMATLNVLKQCGAKITSTDNGLAIDSSKLQKPTAVINVNESGSTLRFVVPVLLYLFGEVAIDGKEGLKKRPHEVFEYIFTSSNIKYNGTSLPIIAQGKMKRGLYCLPGNVSSQFVSGLLYVLPLLDGDSTIEFTSEVESVGYIDLTIDVLLAFGIKISRLENGYSIKGNQNYRKNTVYYNEVDESNINFWRVANSCGANIKFVKENTFSSQPDRQVLDILTKKPTVISVKNIPDSLPILAAYACISKQNISFTDTKRTKIKECNRLKATYEIVKIFGYTAEIDENENLFIFGEEKRKKIKNELYPNIYNDHRMVMMVAILAGMTSTTVTIDNFHAVNKSYPNFFEHFQKLGGKVQKI